MGNALFALYTAQGRMANVQSCICQPKHTACQQTSSWLAGSVPAGGGNGAFEENLAAGLGFFTELAPAPSPCSVGVLGTRGSSAGPAILAGPREAISLFTAPGC